MKLYRLPLVLHKPDDSEEGKYLAEIPALPGCRAWGDTAAAALENLQSVATAFIESYRDGGDALPPEVEAASLESVGSHVVSEVLVAV
jgi:predicted RNase H-like HicB family nuclease